MKTQHGFTLVELVMVIVILGVIGSMAAVFMKGPIDAYFASARRAALTDVADTTLRRMTRDIHKALPNSLRTPGAQCVEFIPTKTGGRYRTTEIAAGDNTSLNFSIADATFNMLGGNNALPANQRIAVNDLIVVYNLGIAGANAYNNDNVAIVSNLGTETAAPIETPITLNPGVQFPLPSPNSRFHVVPAAEPVVGYVCAGGNLRRYTHALPYLAPVACPTPAGTDPILASNVSTCTFNFNGPDLQRNALIRMTLGLTDSDETVTLHHEVHVSSTP